MAGIITTGTINGASTQLARDVRLAIRDSVQAGINAGKTQWSIVDDGFVSGTTERTVFKNTNGFSLMVFNSTTLATTYLHMVMGQNYAGSSSRTFTITSASTTGTTPNYNFVYTTSVNHNIVVGEKVTITGLTDVNYNKTDAVVTAVTANTFTVFSGTVTRTTITGQTGSAGLNPIGAITNAVGNGTNVTYTYTQTNSYRFVPGETVIVANITPTALNVTGTIISATDTTFTIANTSTATYTNGGIVTRENARVAPNSLTNVNFISSSSTYPSNSYGFSGINWNPTAVNTSSSPNAVYNNSNGWVCATTFQAFHAVVDTDWMSFSVKDSNATYKGKSFYVGKFETLVTNPSLSEIAPYVYFQNWQGGSLYEGAGCLHSIGNENKNIEHEFTGIINSWYNNTPIQTDYYKLNTPVYAQPITLVRGGGSSMATMTDSNTAGYERGKLTNIIYIDDGLAVWGDTIKLFNGTEYTYIGGTTSTWNNLDISGFAMWVKTN